MSRETLPAADTTAPDWNEYYTAVAGKPPRETLLAALDRFEREGAGTGRLAVDLGCGEGRDTVELLRRGWRVLAIDAEAAAIQRLMARPDLPPAARTGGLETRVSGFEQTTWPRADLVNASFTLAFCLPEHFPALWQQIVASLNPGGRFAGQLFGDRDEWASNPERTHHRRAAVDELLLPFDVEHFEEVEQDGQTATGRRKHWHVFHIVARKRPT